MSLTKFTSESGTSLFSAMPCSSSVESGCQYTRSKKVYVLIGSDLDIKWHLEIQASSTCQTEDVNKLFICDVLREQTFAKKMVSLDPKVEC